MRTPDNRCPLRTRNFSTNRLCVSPCVTRAWAIRQSCYDNLSDKDSTLRSHARFAYVLLTILRFALELRLWNRQKISQFVCLISLRCVSRLFAIPNSISSSLRVFFGLQCEQKIQSADKNTSKWWIRKLHANPKRIIATNESQGNGAKPS